MWRISFLPFLFLIACCQHIPPRQNCAQIETKLINPVRDKILLSVCTDEIPDKCAPNAANCAKNEILKCVENHHDAKRRQTKAYRLQQCYLDDSTAM